MSERIYPEEDWRKISAITDIPTGPEDLLLSLRRFSNITVDRIPLENSTPQDLKQKMEAIKITIGQIPLTAVLCHAGGYRSPLVAKYLYDEDLASLSMANIDRFTGEIIGRGYDYLKVYGLGINEDGISIHPKESEPIDVLVLNYAMTWHRRGDRATMTKIALMLEQSLQNGIEFKNPLSLVWLEGNEDAFEKWFTV